MSGAGRGRERAGTGEGFAVVGPAPPLRGGIAAHTARLVEHLRDSGREATALSFRRLYPSAFYPGRRQSEEGEGPGWSRADLDVLDPRTGAEAGRRLAQGPRTVVIQWWHPVVAGALLPLVARVERERLVAVVHNALPHEFFPAAAAIARSVLGRCGGLVTHSEAEASRLRALLGPGARIETVALPCLLAAADLEAGAARRPPEAPAPSARILLAAGPRRAYKGSDLLLRAWGNAARPPEAVLALVGENYLGRRGLRLVPRAREADRSILVVDRYVTDQDLASWVMTAEALVLPYLRASQSGVLALGAALGVPALVSDAGGLGGQVGPADRVLPAGDLDALASAIEETFAGSLSEAMASRRREGTAVVPQRLAQEWQRVVEAIEAVRRP
jgi:glycosyltransferase involved in cell wall biosynthesis